MKTAVTIPGMAFKPGTDDLREAPAVWLPEPLPAAGAIIRAYDPVALGHVTATLPDVVAVEGALDPCEGAHAAVVATERDQIGTLDLDGVAKRLAWPVMIDGRHVFGADRAEQAGLLYRCIGRREVETDGELRGAT